MSYTTLNQQVYDPVFQSRIQAAAMKEAWHNEELGATAFGLALKNNQASPQSVFIWPISLDNEDAYAYAVDNDNPNPGGDPGVVSDASIGTGIQTYWPQTWPPPNPMATP